MSARLNKKGEQLYTAVCMREIIIASANGRAAENIKNILQSDSLFVSNIYASGSEILSYASIRPDAVVICGRLSDGMSALTLADMLPGGFDLIWLMPSGEFSPGFVSNLITLNMPVNRIEFVNTVRVLAVTAGERYVRKNLRSKDDEDLLLKAKHRLMERHLISEREAHKLIQRRSMEAGIKLLDIARIIMEEQ